MNYKELHPYTIRKWLLKTSEKEIALVMNASKEAAIEINNYLNDKGKSDINPYRFIQFSDEEKSIALEKFHTELIKTNPSVIKEDEEAIEKAFPKLA